MSGFEQRGTSVRRRERARVGLPWLLALGACGGGDEAATATGGGGRPDVGAELPRGSAELPKGSAELPRPAPFVFTDVTSESGLTAFHQDNGSAAKASIVESVGGGVAFLDADGDGRLDIYLTNGGASAAEPAADALYRGVGDGLRFEDASASFGLGARAWTSGVRAVDLEGDGWTDLYVTGLGPNTLLRNRAGQRFEDVTAAVGVGDPRWSTGALFVDADRDGDLDLYVANYVELDATNPPATSRQYKGLEVFVGPHGLPGARDTFYRNRGDGTFEDATEAAGVADSTGFAFQPVALDTDEDGWLDIYVANDSTPNRLWRNRGDGTFEDVAARVGLSHGKSGKAQAGMGIAVGDVDGDGRFDLYVTNFAEDYNTLYRNLGGGLFADATMRYGVGMSSWSRLGWACGLVDWDNDADPDLFCVNGHVFPQVDEFDSGTSYAQANQFFENVGGARFVEAGAPGGGDLGDVAPSRGAAWADLDHDGDLDLLVGNLDGPPTLLRNDTPERGHWLQIELEATRGHPSALGAVIEVVAPGGTRTYPYGEGSGFLSSSTAPLHVGLGGDAEGIEVRVRWPGGAWEHFDTVEANRRVRLVEGAGAQVAAGG